jgi:predicted TIM-barrel fold metal-dependent hydrolase
VAKCDLAAPDAEETLERHLESPNMRGVRDNGQPGSMDDARWREGYGLLAEHDLVFCHEVGLERMDEAVRLVKAYPDVLFCLDHCAMPRELDDDGFARWRAAIASIAEMPNVSVKVSALGQWGRRWTPESARPWVTACIEIFGTEHAFFGSNFPVDGLFSSYSDLIGTFRDLVSDFSEAEQRALLAGNAERIFRI